MDSPEISISYLLRSFEGYSNVKDHLEWPIPGERYEPLQDESVRGFRVETINGIQLYHTGLGNNYRSNPQFEENIQNLPFLYKGPEPSNLNIQETFSLYLIPVTIFLVSLKPTLFNQRLCFLLKLTCKRKSSILVC